MKICYSILIIASLTPLFIYSSCKKTVTTTCKPEVICTMVFVSVNVQVMDKSGNAIRLDDAYTVRDGTGEKIRYAIHNGAADQTGSYTVLDDSYRKKLALSTAGFHFIGIKDGKQVINEPYTFSADCCHISKVSGNKELVLP